MIDVEHYVFPHSEPCNEPTEDERKQAEQTEAYLKSLPWRPFGVEW